MARSVQVDSGHSWLVLIACSINLAVSSSVGWSSGVYIAAIINYYHSTRSSGFAIGAIMQGFCAFSGPVASVLIDKTSHRTVSIAGAILATFGLVVSANVASMYGLYFTLAITAIGCGFTLQANAVAIMFYFKKHLFLANALSHTAVAVGLMMYPILSQYLIETYTWQPSLYIVAGICLNMTVGSMVIQPALITNRQSEDVCETRNDGLVAFDDEINNKDLLNTTDESTISSTEAKVVCEKMIPHTEHNITSNDKHRTSLSNELLLLKNCHFILFLIGSMLVAANFLPIFVIIPDLYSKAEISESDQSILYMTYGLSNIVGRLLCGIVWLKHFSPVTVFCTSSLLMALVTSLYIIDTNLITLIIANILFGLGLGSFIPCGALVNLDIVGLNNLNRAMSYTILTVGIGGFITPPLLGAVYDATGSYTWPMVIASMFGFLSIAVMLPNTSLKNLRFRTCC